MPGVIMENGSRNGSHTNHERDQPPNAANGSSYVSEKGVEKGKGFAERQQNVTPISPTVPNGTNGVFMSNSHVAMPNDLKSPIDSLPPEITHIVGHYMPLSKMLSRVAQKTHNNLQRTILELDQMPKPAMLLNGHAAQTQGDGDKLADDTNKESIDKKLRALKFAQDAHTEMTKALVITNWSRRSEDVSKLIDLKVHLDTQKSHYDYAVHELAEIKRTLGQARLPNPDLKTAVAVLSTGKAPWMPEFGYIQPPPLTAKDILKSLQNLDTLLSIRLNLDEHDKIPYHFQDYSIKNGRVTFKVENEFEVDLTIADEDPASQFWFIDFRFTFAPTIQNIAPNLRSYIESTVNKTLREGGLAGCYKFLHSMVLTHQISEFRRQAVEMSRGKWVETLKIEALNRSLSIQYWLNRYGPKGPKSWIILGVHSGKAIDRIAHPKDTSRVSLRWFRDGKEITNPDIPIDTVHISTESLLKAVIAQHIDHILSSTLDALMPKPIYAQGDALGLTIITEEPAESCLEVQIATGRRVSIKIEPITGRFVLSPMTRTNIQHEYRMNEGILNPAERLHPRIDDIRYDTIQELILSHGAVTGWQRCDNPGLGRDDIGKLVPKDTTRILWLKRAEWTRNRYLAVSMGPGGEGRWLVETTDPAPQVIVARPRKQDVKLLVKVISFIRVPIKNNSPLPTYNFMTKLHIFTAGLMSHHATLKAMHALRAAHMLHESRQTRNTMRLPAIFAKISDLVEWHNKNTKNLVKLTFQGLEVGPPSPIDTDEGAQSLKPPLNSVAMVTEARINISIPENILKVKERIDRDIAFDPKTRCLALRLRHNIGEPILQPLIKRVTEVICMLEFSKVIEEHGEDLDCVQISLGKIAFAYGPRLNIQPDSMDLEGSSRQYKAVVDFSATENAMSLVLEHDNPHLQIADFMSRILNGKEGLRGVATLLPLTLPVLIGLDAIQMAWGSVSKLKGDSFVLTRAADWYLIRYIIYSPSMDPSAIQLSRKVELEIKLRNRGCDPWWYVRRIDQREPLSDDIDEVLKPVWNMVGNGYRGMRTSSVAQAEGVEELLRKVDDAIRSFVITQKANLPPTATAATAQKARPQPPQQQRQQQPTPNQSQNSQGRPNTNNQFGRRDIVEID